MMQAVTRSKSALHVMLLVAIGIVLASRVVLSVRRYIDPDEFAHLHWTYLFTTGSLPFRDFFFHFTPVYFWWLAPVFLLPPSGASVIVARMWQFLLYLAVTILTYRIGQRLTKNATVSLLGTFLFLVFPMTLDKTLELRGDLLMTALFLASFLLLLASRTSKSIAFLATLLYAGSLVTLAKIGYAAPSVAYLFWRRWRARQPWGVLALGLFTPFVLVFSYLLANGIVTSAFDGIVKGSYAIKTGEPTFTPWLALASFPLVYVTAGGVSFPWFVNTLLWVLAIPGLILLWLSNREGARAVLLLLAGGIVALFLFPTPYLQYFIPLSVFVAIPAALPIHRGIEHISKRWASHGVFLVLLLSFLLSFGIQGADRIDNTNNEQLAVIDDVLTISRPDETFYDMVGSYVFRPDGYYVCCNIYSEFADRLPTKLPTLRQSLVDRRTKFVILDRAGKVFWRSLADDKVFMLTHYLPSAYNKIYSAGVQFTCVSGLCTQIDLNGKSLTLSPRNAFDLPVSERYRIRKEPSEETVTIDGGRTGDVISLAQGFHTFDVTVGLKSLRIQLDREGGLTASAPVDSLE